MTTATTTTEVHRPTRRRGLSIFFTPPHGPDFLSALPSELILRILELAISDNRSKASSLALTSKHLSSLIDLIIYANVILPDPRRIDLFLRTTLSKTPAFLASHVKKLAVTWTGPMPRRLEDEMAKIVHACSGLRTLAVPPKLAPFFSRDSKSCPSPFEIVIGSYIDLSPKPTLSFYLPAGASSGSDNVKSPVPEASLFSSLTHLRFCQPPDYYHSPLSSICSFAASSDSGIAIPNLTHLQLSRRARANEENDHQFISDIRSLLASRPSLKVLAVSVFGSIFNQLDQEREDVTSSSIWKSLEDVAKDDERLVLVEGVYGEWAKEWSQFGSGEFWERIRGIMQGRKTECVYYY